MSADDAAQGTKLLAELTAGDVAVGVPDPIISLLTCGEDGFVQHCALSRTEVAVVGRHVDIAITARRTRANLARTGQATLVAIIASSIMSFRLTAIRSVDRDGIVATRFDVRGCDRDDLGVPLTSATFVATSRLVELERWDETRAALLALREGD